LACEGQRHIQTAPVVSTAAPLLRPRPLSLRRQAVIEEEPRIALQRAQTGAVGEYPRCTHQMPRPCCAAFYSLCVQQGEVDPWFGHRMVTIGRMEICDMVALALISLFDDLPGDIRGCCCVSDEFYPGVREV